MRELRGRRIERILNSIEEYLERNGELQRKRSEIDRDRVRSFELYFVIIDRTAFRLKSISILERRNEIMLHLRVKPNTKIDDNEK